MNGSVLLALTQETTVLPGQRVFIAPGAPSGGLKPVFSSVGALPRLRVGTHLGRMAGTPLFQVAGRMRWPQGGAAPALDVVLADALDEVYFPMGATTLLAWSGGFSLAWVTLSDKGAAGLRDDASGPLIGDMVAAELGLSSIQGHILPDDPRQLKALIMDLALAQGFDIVVTTGGTGVAPRDITPEATGAVLETRLPGFETAMAMAGIQSTPRAVISRAMAGFVGNTLVVNLPGSPKGVRETLAAVLPAFEHALEKRQGDPGDCGGA
ncbi:Molybdopterin adenylyltransferase [Fundidesulfovibrio magnetotacticus]|uniref:Molybdopterin adenylyltransferase n=1 Tax=Fundidesulfovibrio magnetotacticus TaxID=2730080 RepID=A0A6V8LQC3_9BACT|nr:MogA/MoaB family molybdenum cofactor biosynthesis protein [Fundidesulfovibrio magnetotacticus]GFK93934.1 Molybdopterin adenylyltransferase [Fundidesulfovibrio magnetotacticus]